MEGAVPTTVGTSTSSKDGEMSWFALGSVCLVSDSDQRGEGCVQLSGHGKLATARCVCHSSFLHLSDSAGYLAPILHRSAMLDV